MATKANPFTIQDLQRPADEGRSLHDEVSEFFRSKMGVSTPITSSNIPRSRQVAEAFTKIGENEERFKQLLVDLQATKLHDLWPGHDGPPPTKEGVAWHAANSLLPVQPPGEHGQKADYKDLQNEEGKKSTKRKSNPKKGNKGHAKGSKGWKDDEYDALLDAIEEIVPTGSMKWELVAEAHYKNGYSRTADSLKRRFDQLWNTAKPTGSTFIPRIVARAKEIKENICREEVIGYSSVNDSNESDSSPSSTGLEGTKLTDENGNFRRPVTKKRRSTDLTAAITDLAGEQKDMIENFAATLMKPLDRLVGSIGPFLGDDGSSRDSALERKVDGLEKKLADVESKLDNLANVENKLDILLDHLLHKKTG